MRRHFVLCHSRHSTRLQPLTRFIIQMSTTDISLPFAILKSKRFSLPKWSKSLFILDWSNFPHILNPIFWSSPFHCYNMGWISIVASLILSDCDFFLSHQIVLPGVHDCGNFLMKKATHRKCRQICPINRLSCESSCMISSQFPLISMLNVGPNVFSPCQNSPFAPGNQFHIFLFHATKHWCIYVSRVLWFAVGLGR